MKTTLGVLISQLRKEKGITQAQLAEHIGVTDKAVSKWERDLSCPDIKSIPKLAEVLGVSVEQLMQCENSSKSSGKEFNEVLSIALRAIPLAMGIAVTVLTVLNKADFNSSVSMLGIGLASMSLYLLKYNK